MKSYITKSLNAFFFNKGIPHKAHIYKSTTVYVPSSELGLSPPLLSPATVPLPPNQRGGHARRRAMGWGSPNSDDWRKA